MPNDRTPSHPKGPYFFQKRTEGPVDITITESQISDLDHYDDADFDTRLATKDTDDLTEGTNLYFTNARADARIALATLADLASASASDIDGGTLADARLSANVPLLDAANVFTGLQTVKRSGNQDQLLLERPSTGDVRLLLRTPDGETKIAFQRGSENRWLALVTPDDNDGDNDGAAYQLSAFDDSGSFIGSTFVMKRLPLRSDFSSINGAIRLGGGAPTGGEEGIGFYGTTPIAKQTSVAVSAAGIHAALVNLGLISGP